MIPPSALLKVASIIMAAFGLGYVLMPNMHLHLMFNEMKLQSAKPFASCLMQCLGGVVLTLAALFWTAAPVVHKKMCLSIASGFGAGVLIKLYQLLFGYTGMQRDGQYEATLAALVHLAFNLVMCVLFFVSASHPEANKPVRFPSAMETGGGQMGGSKTGGGKHD